ncbi:WD repeat, SAM and U-box domain-containing protein 1 isoform X2 [Anabrus simplex]|uniref:WD repeat, SAM and U-box domain-containing protein 1 isoform X2 n=1 Tax=Anabrus simplex TaxID=316456 RepID=UPI0035A28502
MEALHCGMFVTFQQHEGTIQAIGITPDSSHLLTTCTLGVMKLWQLAGCDEDTDRCLTSVDDAHDLGVMSTDFCPIQELYEEDDMMYHRYLMVTSGNDNLVKLWQISVGQKLKYQTTTPCQITLHLVLDGHTSAVTCVRFSPAGTHVVSSSLDKTIRIWEVEGNCVAVLEGHTRYVVCCAFSRDGSLLASGSNDKSVMVWGVAEGVNVDSELIKPCTAFSHYGNNNKECQQVEEQDLVKHAETDGTEVQLFQRLDTFGGAVNTCDFHGSKFLACGNGDKMVRLWLRGEDGRFEESDVSPLEGHRYSVNQVEFSPSGDTLASCSLDGTTVLWDVETGRRARPSFQCSGSGVRTSRFSPDGHLLATAGDDEKACVWNVNTMEMIVVVEGHSDAIVAVAFTPDSQLLTTASSDGNFKLWCVTPCSDQCVLTQEEAHDLGVQSVDFSPSEGLPGTDHRGGRQYRYMLATCGNDSLVKLWHITAYPDEEGDDVPVLTAESELWKTLSGHGGNVMCVRFSPGTGEILASSATDKTVRLWNVYTGDCVHVLEGHDSMVTTCAFSGDCSLLATGSLDKSIIVWELPQELVFQSVATERLRSHRKKLLEWSTDDISHWLEDSQLPEVASLVRTSNMTGQQLLTLPIEEVLDILQLEDEELRSKVQLLVFWLHKEDAGILELPLDSDIPHEFLCPITHEVMLDPVICADGFTYERAAINEWFLSGRFTSPMTNAHLSDTKCIPNTALKMAICQFLFGETVS